MGFWDDVGSFAASAAPVVLGTVGTVVAPGVGTAIGTAVGGAISGAVKKEQAKGEQEAQVRAAYEKHRKEFVQAAATGQKALDAAVARAKKAVGKSKKQMSGLKARQAKASAKRWAKMYVDRGGTTNVPDRVMAHPAFAAEVKRLGGVKAKASAPVVAQAAAPRAAVQPAVARAVPMVQRPPPGAFPLGPEQIQQLLAALQRQLPPMPMVQRPPPGAMPYGYQPPYAAFGRWR